MSEEQAIPEIEQVLFEAKVGGQVRKYDCWKAFLVLYLKPRGIYEIITEINDQTREMEERLAAQVELMDKVVEAFDEQPFEMKNGKPTGITIDEAYHLTIAYLNFVGECKKKLPTWLVSLAHSDQSFMELFRTTDTDSSSQSTETTSSTTEPSQPSSETPQTTKDLQKTGSES